MKLPRKCRMLTALVALFGMLFMQLAMASHACPVLLAGHGKVAGVTSHTAMQSMPDCDEPDSANLALCQAHCQDAKTALDKPQMPPIAQAVAIVSSILTPLDPWIPIALPAFASDFSLQRIASPPISIRHCCLRV